MKNIFSNAPKFLSIVATIAITWYICSTYNILSSTWCLPLVAIIAGLSVFVIPAIANHFEAIWSIIPTGLTLLLLQIFPQIFSIPFLGKLWSHCIVLFIIALITEICAYGFHVIHPGEIVIDAIICIITSLLIVNIGTPLFTTLVVFVGFICILTIDLSCTFSHKRNRKFYFDDTP